MKKWQNWVLRFPDQTLKQSLNRWIIFIFVIGLTLLFKRSANIANKTIGFGRSQPRIKALDDQQVRFEDVAGVNEETEELKEVVTFLKKPDKLIALGAKIPKVFCWLALLVLEKHY